jgi:hypothetical protein
MSGKHIGTALLLLLFTCSVYGVKGPQIVYPSKNLIVLTLDPLFTWKPISKTGVVYEIKIAEDQAFTTHVIQLKTSSASLALTLPYFQKSKSYFWTIRALYTEKGQLVQTNWAHEDKKDMSYFQFTINSEATGMVGFQPVNVTPDPNAVLNTLQPEFRWLYPDHSLADFEIKSVKNEWVSPKLNKITYQLVISSSRDFKEDAKTKTFNITNDSLRFKLTMPWLEKGAKYYWKIKAVYMDPEKGAIQESEWSSSPAEPNVPSLFGISDQAKGVFGFNEGQKEELFDRSILKSVERLTTGTDNCFAPAVSKDGQKLAYCIDRNGQIEIYEINLTERLSGYGSRKTVSQPGKVCFNPFWLHNNTDVAFYSNRINENFWHLFSTTKGTGVTIRDGDLDMDENRDNFNLYGSCSSDGKIVYTGKTRNSNTYDLYLLDMVTYTKTQLLPGLFPDIRNDDRIVYAYRPNPKVPDDYEITVGTLEGNGIVDPTILSNNPANDYDPAFSPDGSRIAFTSTRSGNSDIWVMDSDGNNLSQLTLHPMVDRRPQWVDNETIVFQSNRFMNDNNEPVNNMYRMKVPKQ